MLPEVFRIRIITFIVFIVGLLFCSRLFREIKIPFRVKSNNERLDYIEDAIFSRKLNFIIFVSVMTLLILGGRIYESILTDAAKLSLGSNRNQKNQSNQLPDSSRDNKANSTSREIDR